MTARSTSISWSDRAAPLPATAVAAPAAAAAALASSARLRIEVGASLRAAWAGDWLIVLGAPADLPWAEGCTYLAAVDGALVPTTSICHPPVDLVRRAALLIAGLDPDGASQLVAILPGAVLVGAMPGGCVEVAHLDAIERRSGETPGSS